MIVVRELTLEDQNVPAAPGTEVELFEGIPQSGWTLGDPDAPVTVVEFVDMQCPFCAQFSKNDFVSIVDRYVRPGDVKFEMRTLAFIGPDSVRAGEAVAAAAAENKAWDFAHAFFESQGVENTGYVDDDFLRGLAGAVPGLDGGVVTRRGDSSGMKLAERQAQEARVESTPSFLVNGELVTADGLEEAIEAAL